MKICQIKNSEQPFERERMAILIEDNLAVDVQNIWKKYFQYKNKFNYIEMANHFIPSTTSNFIKLYQENAITKLKETLSLYHELKNKENMNSILYSLNQSNGLKLTKPISTINCYRDFYIHEKHVKKGFDKRKEKVPDAWYELPVYYKGPTSGFIGPDEKILWPHYSQKLDYELELGCILSTDGKDISEKNALNHVFGYTILNDISARDIQKKEMSVRLGPSKGKDFCSVIGPVIITQDEFAEEEPDLLMKAFINSEKWSEGRSSEGRYSWRQMIAFASQSEWLLSTDFLGSGTVGTGCGLELDKWITKEDHISLFIEKIGTLNNTITTTC